MRGHCDKCGSNEGYNFAINNGMCDACIILELERLEAEIANFDKIKAEYILAHSQAVLGLESDIHSLQENVDKYKAVLLRCKKAMEGSNCNELNWINEALGGDRV